MIKIVALWERAPDPDWYRRHIALARTIPGVKASHGPIFGGPPGTTPDAAYSAQLEFADIDAFQHAAASPEFQATVEDAGTAAIPLRVYFVEVTDD